MSNQTRGGRINRINPLIQKIISSALLRNSDPVLNKATITHVSTSPDLKKSMVFVSTLDGNEGSLKTALEKNRTKIQKVLAREMIEYQRPCPQDALQPNDFPYYEGVTLKKPLSKGAHLTVTYFV